MDGSGNANPQALNCNLATQGFLCVITPHWPGMELRVVVGGTGRCATLSPKELWVQTAVAIIPPAPVLC